MSLLGVLDGQEVVVAALRIDPDRRRDHLVRGERRDDVGDHVALAQPEPRRLHAIDVDVERRVARLPAGRTCRRPRAAGGSTRSTVAARPSCSVVVVGPAQLHVDRRGETEVQHRVDDAARTGRTPAPAARGCRSALAQRVACSPKSSRSWSGVEAHHDEARSRSRRWASRSPRSRARGRGSTPPCRDRAPGSRRGRPARPARSAPRSTSMRDPSGARRLMMNCPASVRGKSSVPSQP